MIDSDHPNFADYEEEYELARWIDSGDPLPAAEPPAGIAQKSHRPPPPTLGLNLSDSAKALGVSDDFFRESVKPNLQIVRTGRKQIVSTSELQRWLDEHQEPA